MEHTFESEIEKNGQEIPVQIEVEFDLWKDWDENHRSIAGYEIKSFQVYTESSAQITNELSELELKKFRLECEEEIDDNLSDFLDDLEDSKADDAYEAMRDDQ